MRWALSLKKIITAALFIFVVFFLTVNNTVYSVYTIPDVPSGGTTTPYTSGGYTEQQILNMYCGGSPAGCAAAGSGLAGSNATGYGGSQYAGFYYSPISVNWYPIGVPAAEVVDNVGEGADRRIMGRWQTKNFALVKIKYNFDMQGKTKSLVRFSEAQIRDLIAEGKSFLLLGPRQVGKTTLLNALAQHANPILTYQLQEPAVKIELERDPQKMIREARAMEGHISIFVDEAQKVPRLFDAAQTLIDEGKASVFLTGSSARKLRGKGVNLLPGRIRLLTLDPLMWGEMGMLEHTDHPAIPNLSTRNANPLAQSMQDYLVYGGLPGLLTLSRADAVEILQAYARLYIEEEIRAEALSRAIGPFARFLELAALESGTSPNFTKLSKESGVSAPTIRQYYSVLEDTLIVERVDPYIKNARKRVLSSSRYYFFDTGVRNALARLPLAPELLQVEKGRLFEHAVVLELIRRIRLLKTNHKLYYWRTSSGAEVDCILESHDGLIPIEIKSSTQVSQRDLTGLRSFMADYGHKVNHAYVVTMGSRPEKLDDKITAIPWQYL